MENCIVEVNKDWHDQCSRKRGHRPAGLYRKRYANWREAAAL